jgi:hypothetical protein
VKEKIEEWKEKRGGRNEGGRWQLRLPYLRPVLYLYLHQYLYRAFLTLFTSLAATNSDGASIVTAGATHVGIHRRPERRILFPYRSFLFIVQQFRQSSGIHKSAHVCGFCATHNYQLHLLEGLRAERDMHYH